MGVASKYLITTTKYKNLKCRNESEKVAAMSSNSNVSSKRIRLVFNNCY